MKDNRLCVMMIPKGTVKSFRILNSRFNSTILINRMLDRQMALNMLYTSLTPVWRTIPLCEPVNKKEAVAIKATIGSWINNLLVSKFRVRLKRMRYENTNETEITHTSITSTCLLYTSPSPRDGLLS